ncbi:hypothetical protein DFJ58DRAFT_844539 [Suillus subalutaceus]|uniref:uncharacterized protein n=1 Tax=Suillus subalutaceus TaxID=48586 RepID=UPI001B884C1D|nr:uncharacterized protein DFJ58DRAFT_844539 [Suillus subalutaceus]KAG1842884.1 hypothetical protein DFJ58DRAFT_844539 [Suillus subalutaceus]
MSIGSTPRGPGSSSIPDRRGNQRPASESILRVKHLTLQHSADHWEELHAPIHTIFGWGQEGGLLSSKSSQADFLVIHDFLNTFAHVEQEVGEGSCLSAVVPRMRTALELCQKAPQSPVQDSDPLSHKSCGNQSVPLYQHANPSRTTSTPLPVRSDTRPKEYIEISEGSNEVDEGSSDGSEGHDTDNERTHQNRVQAAVGSRVTKQTTTEQWVQRLNEAKNQGLINDFGPTFIKCRCGVTIKLDSGECQTLQKLDSRKSCDKLPKKRQYDLSKYDHHLQRCPWVTGSRSKSKTKKEYIPISKKSLETIERKSPQSKVPLPTVMQVDGANIDTGVACLGRADGAYALLAKNAVAGDVGGVGSIASHIEIAKVLFPYKYRGWSAQEETTDDISATPSQRNMHTSITKFSQEELAILGQELLSRRHWFVENGCDAGSHIIRSASKRDKADAQLSETDRNKVEKRQVHRAYQLLENDDYGQVFLELFKHANSGHLQEHGLFVKIAEVLANKVGRAHSDNPNVKYGARYDSEVMKFFIAMRGYGSQSAVQYGLLSQVIGGVCQCRLCPIPLLVAPSQGKETAEDNACTLLDCLSLCWRAGLAVISCGSDGASSEVGAHDIIHNSVSEWLTFSIEKFGFIFNIPIFPTGPLVTVPDLSHVQKVLRNNKQSGTHLLSAGNYCLTHQTLVALCKEPNSGMVKKDVENTDKQDDGAAIRLFHSNALRACLMGDDIVNIAWEDVMAIFNDALGVLNISPLPLVFTASQTETARLKRAGKQKARCEDDSGSEDGENDDGDLENTAPLRLAAAQAESDAHDLCDPSIPDSVQHAKALHHMSRMSALMADLEDAEEVKEQSSQKPRAIVLSIVDLLNPAPPSNQLSEHANMLLLWSACANLMTETQVFCLKDLSSRRPNTPTMSLRNLARTTTQLDSAAGLGVSDGNGVSHVQMKSNMSFSIQFTTNDDLQLLMHK